MLFRSLLVETVYWVAFLSGFTCIVLMLFLDKYMKKRTQLGNELLGKIKGFKRFLETAEKHKLEQLVRQTPDYFYDILPFTYVLGVSEVWIKKFENIAIQQPKWYSGSSAFSHAAFGSFMNSTMKSASSATASFPPRRSRRIISLTGAKAPSAYPCMFEVLLRYSCVNF